MKIKSEQMKNHLITYKQHSVFIQPVRKSYNYTTLTSVLFFITKKKIWFFVLRSIKHSCKKYNLKYDEDKESWAG